MEQHGNIKFKYKLHCNLSLHQPEFFLSPYFKKKVVALLLLSSDR